MIIRRIVAMSLFASALSGCAGVVTHDGNSFSQAPVRVDSEYKADEMLIKWIRVDPSEFDEMGAQVRSVFSLKSGGVAGMSIMNPERGKCLVIAPEPLLDGDQSMHTLGHEVLHCFDGRWHEAWWGGMPRNAASLDEVQRLALELLDQFMPDIADDARAFFTAN
ncbi:MAG: hypothetical protein ACOYYI_01220 [Chloroflexota bacterium]